MIRFLNALFILCLLFSGSSHSDHTPLNSASIKSPSSNIKPHHHGISKGPSTVDSFLGHNESPMVESNNDTKILTHQSTGNSDHAISWDIDKDGNLDALSDGLLMLRYTFGLRGNSLVVGAIAEDSPLSAEAVISQLEATFSIADIDGDGKVDALSDGLILLRYLFNLSGESLIVNAVSLEATRTSIASIEAYLESYLPSSSNNPATVTISGNITFDLIPFKQFGDGLDINNTYASAARGVIVEALDNNDNVVATTSTDNSGSYSFSADKDLELRVRVSAKMLNTNYTPWDVQVFDNTTNVGGQNPLYVTDSSVFTTSDDTIKNLHLPAGRNGENSGIRSAAPFAILDIIYESMQTVAAIEPTIAFPPLEVYWSPDNNASSGAVEDGDLGSSFFQIPNEIYILGDEDSDTDEYDRHVIAHEWIHYFEDNFSRSDSLGGSHGVDDQLDMRVAYSEALANALSGIITGDAVYRDSDSFWPYYGWSMDMESNYSYNPGWFNEGSIQSIIYDLYDSQSDGVDNIALGFGPILNTLTSADYINDDYQISIFSFTEYLKAQQPVTNVTKIENLVNAQQIYGTGTDGSDETNDGGIASVLPIYTLIFANGPSKQVCYDNNSGVLNKLGNRSFLVFDPPTAGIYTIALTPVSAASASLDADLAIHKQGVTIGRDYSPGYNGRADLYISLTTGKHIIEAGVWDPDQMTPLGNYCFNVEITN
jgi:hypothetical protein